jgi:hypothetical protein
MKLTKSEIIQRLWREYLKYYCQIGINYYHPILDYQETLKDASVEDICEHLVGEVSLADLKRRYQENE